MPVINIQGNIINFPDSGTSPNWAPAVIAFAKAVEAVLTLLVGPADVTPQNFTIDAYNPGTNVDVPNLQFATSLVRAAFIRYSVFRQTTTDTVAQAGTIMIVYNPDGPVNNKWEITQQIDGDADITFSITDTGQVQFTTTALGGLSHTGKLAYSAQALLQS